MQPIFAHRENDYPPFLGTCFWRWW